MIGWLKGNRITEWTQGNKVGVVLDCSGVGYEIQVLCRDRTYLNKKINLNLWIHQVQRDDGSNLFGFICQRDRDLFRKLLSVNGVGPQLAISLLEANESSQLIRAIVQKDITKLMESQGVGKRVGERLIVELQNKLDEFNIKSKEVLPDQSFSKRKSTIQQDIIEELKDVLRSLEYEDSEIVGALKAIEESNNTANLKDKNQSTSFEFELLLKESLIFLSQ